MSNRNFDTIDSLQPGRYDYKIKVRVIKIWRGSTRTGELFKGFNIILLDKLRSRIHAFIPGLCAEEMEGKIQLGKVYGIKNFTVQPYKAVDIYRCLRTDNQLIFSKNTKIEDMEDKGTGIQQQMFDFIDHSQISSLAEQKTYLADVVGIIKQKDFREFGKDGKNQKQTKLTITDGSSNVKVTFWENFAVNLETSINAQIQTPIIIIISSGKIGKWNGEVEISNVSPTTFYLNYNHHSVVNLRKRLTEPDFADNVLSIPAKKKLELRTLEEITKLGKEYIQAQVLAHVNIMDVDNTSKWYFNACTTCDKGTKLIQGLQFCENCQRTVPHPEKRYKLHVGASDATGAIDIILPDRQVRTLTNKRARDLYNEQNKSDNLPGCLKEIARKEYTVTLRIKHVNVVDHFQVYWATNICHGFVLPPEEITQTSNNMEASSSMATTSTYQLQGISDMQIQSN